MDKPTKPLKLPVLPSCIAAVSYGALAGLFAVHIWIDRQRTGRLPIDVVSWRYPDEIATDAASIVKLAAKKAGPGCPKPEWAWIAMLSPGKSSPCEADLGPLCQALHKAGLKVALETDGSLPIPDSWHIDHICLHLAAHLGSAPIAANMKGAKDVVAIVRSGADLEALQPFLRQARAVATLVPRELNDPAPIDCLFAAAQRHRLRVCSIASPWAYTAAGLFERDHRLGRSVADSYQGAWLKRAQKIRHDRLAGCADLPHNHDLHDALAPLLDLHAALEADKCPGGLPVPAGLLAYYDPKLPTADPLQARTVSRGVWELRPAADSAGKLCDLDPRRLLRQLALYGDTVHSETLAASRFYVNAARRANAQE